MNPRRWLSLVVAAWALGAGEARAHFLFARIGPMAEGGRSAEVYFSERAEAGDPKFVDKVAGTKLWLQAEPGQFQPLHLRRCSDRLRAWLPATGSLMVVGACEYGVLARPGQTPFLLRYYPKAMAGRPDELNRMVAWDQVPLEVAAKVEGDRLRLSALKRGKPVPRAVFQAVDVDLTESQIVADETGTAVWTPPAAGEYSIYTRDVTRVAGELGGKPFEEVREFATLALAWPLARAGADPEAVALFQDALSCRAQWGDDFPGFSADAAGAIDGRAFSGRVTVRPTGSVEVKVDVPAARLWLEDQVGSIAMHRIAGATGDDARPTVRFADDCDDHPLGRLLAFEGGRFASSYRVKDHQIMVVNRHTGRLNMTITVVDNDKNAEGRYLPHSYLVHYWDAATRSLDRVETIQERWHRVGSWDLPAAHTVTTASDAGLSTRCVNLSGHALLKPE
jgi:hypothetical protein